MRAYARVGYSYDAPKLVLDRMSDAIASSFVPGFKLPDASRQYMSWQPSDMARDLLVRRGINVRGWSTARIIDQALHTTSDFPELLGTSANKIFLGSYEAAPQTFRNIAARIDLSNFQAHNLLRDGDYPTLSKILESGEFTYGTISESKEAATLSTYGKTFAISRQALVNDSLGVFGRMVAKIGQAVARFENATVWAIVTGNPTLSVDSTAMFHANHGNLAGSGAAISQTTLGTARAAMRVQKSLDGNTLNIAPVYLVVPAAKETVAESVVSPLVIPEQASNLTPPSLRLRVVTEALLDTNSTTAWYVFADPMLSGANIVYGYLEGEAAPRVRTNDPFNVDGIEFQVRLDFHATAVDFRFGYKNPGA
jgi:phage major head subunit gpT-like protein